MREIDLHLPSILKDAAIQDLVARACAAEGLRVSLKGTLAKYPGSVHWHLKNGKQPGTLELTWWPPARRLWFKVAAGREADWVDESLGRLLERIERGL
jgi:hypothetical protein